MRSKNCLSVFSRKHFKKVLKPSVIYLPVFWLQLLSAFAIIFAECHGLCTHVQASWYIALFRVSLPCVGLRCVGLAQKISAHCKRVVQYTQWRVGGRRYGNESACLKHIFNFYFAGILLSGVRNQKSNWKIPFFSACSYLGESINTFSGHISSPNFPNNYDANRICTWNITVPGGKIIKLTFLNFTLVAGENDDCAGAAADSARVFITNVASHGGKPNDFKICGQKLPPPVYSEGNFIQVRFESRTGPVNKGFNATFEAIDGDSRKSFSSMIVY